ncbi:uncharacterized protein LOC109797975 [Cajanus cajan]|uniref:PB1 domain-containing protein n=1 Tax=Cajanus cajan TaxID=3821 RepID=A0A151TT20_CAJCA|nr:uncharacterized protein LOC109797975 [Cajanus cajan]KYP70223.1 hypothetical protein KK1_009434 [Cajanus cajan]
MGSKPLDNNNNTIKFLYSYGGKIRPRRTDGMLRYCGGHTRVLALNPSASFSELMAKLSESCGSPVKLRCPLPNGDLDTLVSVTNDEDLANIIEESDRASSSLPQPLKIRAILSPPKKLSPATSSSSSATPSPSGSSHSSSADSLPPSAAHRFVRRYCSPAPVIGVRNGTGKGCWCTGHLERSPRFLYRGPHRNNYCY